MSETITQFRHPTLPIAAGREHWSAAGYNCYANTDVVGGGPYHFEELLILALAAGKRDQDAVAWAIAERQRRLEESARSSAIAAEAKAIDRLAASIREVGEEEVLKRLLGRLT